jgi:dimethylargininase
MKYTRAIVRVPGKSIICGLSSSGKTVPVYEKTLEQHHQYVAALEKCGLSVQSLEAVEAFPDSTFVEDVAVLTPHCAILTAPGAASRRDEVVIIRQTLEEHSLQIEKIEEPGTLEGGDIMQIGHHFYIGLSNRTNHSGAQQLIDILKKYGMTGSTVPVKNFLHLKTGVTWIGGNLLIAANGAIPHGKFRNFEIISIPADEPGAANCIAINDKIMMPAGFPKTKELLGQVGSEIIEIDISEFAKIDGGLTCLSLRF